MFMLLIEYDPYFVFVFSCLKAKIFLETFKLNIAQNIATNYNIYFKYSILLEYSALTQGNVNRY